MKINNPLDRVMGLTTALNKAATKVLQDNWQAERDAAEENAQRKACDELREEIERFLSLQLPQDRRVDYGYPGFLGFLEEVAQPGAHREFDAAFIECFQSYVRRESWIPAERRADGLLDAFFRVDKIRSLLEAIVSFTETIEEADDVETTARIVFSNYVFFLRRQVTEALAAYDSCTDEAYEGKDSPEAVCEFILSECQTVASLKDLPAAWALLLRAKWDGQRLSQPQWSGLTAIYELFERRDENIEQIREITMRFARQEEKRRSKVLQAAQLRVVLGELLTDAWFNAFDPKTSVNEDGMKGMTAMELRQWYIRCLAPVRKNLLNRFQGE